MKDFNSAQEAALNNVEESPTKNSGRNDFWKGMLRTVLSISIYRKMTTTPFLQ